MSNKVNMITLSNGVEMPQIGYGVYQIPMEETERCVLDALSVGYRHIDTAQSYFNEEAVGNAIVKSGIPRNEIFITTKVWIDNYGYDKCRASVLESMRKLKTDYIDLVLLHQPFSDYYGAWHALEDLYDEGKIRAIGISNFYSDRVVDLASFSRIPPMVNQIETHPYNAQIEARKWLDKYHIAHEAWAPLGELRNGILTDPVLVKIAEAHHKTVAQVILRYEYQRGIIIIPKSTHKERMIENLDILDFELTSEEMDEIIGLDRQESLFFSHEDPNTVEWFTNMVQERRGK